MKLSFRAKKDADMTEGPILFHILQFSLPMMVGLLFQQLYNTVDTIVVGNFCGEDALAAVGTVGSVTNMLVGLCSGLSLGAGVLISQRYGAHDDRGLSNAVHTAILVSFILGVVITALGVAIVTPMLILIKMPEEVMPLGKTYLTIYFAGVSSQLIYNMGSGVLRAVGDTRRPLYFLIVTSIINTVGDLLLVIVFDLGVAGVAYATIFSELVSAVLVLFVLTKEKGTYALHWSKLRIDKPSLLTILRIGLPTSIQQAVTSFSNVFVQSYINVFGKTVMAGWTTYSKLDTFVMLPIMSIGYAASTFVGQNYGARKYERAKKGSRTCIFLSLGVAAVCIALVMGVRYPLFHIITQEEKVIEYASLFIMLNSPWYLTVCFNQIYSGSLRGVGNTKVPMFVMLGSFVAFRQIYLYFNHLITADMSTLLFGHPISLVTTSVGYPVGWIMCSILMAIFYRRCILFKLKDGEEPPEK